jgi:hypothetical protein
MDERKAYMVLGFVIVILLLTGGTDLITSFYGTPKSQKNEILL